MNSVRQWRSEGSQVCYTMDAGPNVHVICREMESQLIEQRLRALRGVEDVLVARPGGPAKIVENGK